MLAKSDTTLPPPTTIMFDSGKNISSLISSIVAWCHTCQSTSLWCKLCLSKLYPKMGGPQIQIPLCVCLPKVLILKKC